MKAQNRKARSHAYRVHDRSRLSFQGNWYVCPGLLNRLACREFEIYYDRRDISVIYLFVDGSYVGEAYCPACMGNGSVRGKLPPCVVRMQQRRRLPLPPAPTFGHRSRQRSKRPKSSAAGLSARVKRRDSSTGNEGDPSSPCVSNARKPCSSRGAEPPVGQSHPRPGERAARANPSHPLSREGGGPMTPRTLPLFDGFIETPFEQRFQSLLRQAWHQRSWHVIVAEPGSGKTMGICDLRDDAQRAAGIVGGRAIRCSQ